MIKKTLSKNLTLLKSKLIRPLVSVEVVHYVVTAHNTNKRRLKARVSAAAKK